MKSSIRARAPLVVLACLLAQSSGKVFAAGGTSVIATKGQPAHVEASWAEGVGDLVNDPLRTSGWNSWFTEWPNDVNHYAFDAKSPDELNRLFTKLAAIKSDLRQVRLSTSRNPKGWVGFSRLPEGNNIPIVFSIGNQARIDEWYKHVRKPFGVMEFTAAPVAVPPTLTIFVQNDSVKLEELKIPDGVELSMGHVPTVFHRFNTKGEQEKQKQEEKEQEKKKQKETRDSAKVKQKLDEASLMAIAEIESFLKSHKDKKNGTAEPSTTR